MMTPQTHAGSCSKCSCTATMYLAPCRHKFSSHSTWYRRLVLYTHSARRRQSSARQCTAQEQPVRVPAASSSARSPAKLASLAVVLVVASTLCYKQLSRQELPELPPQLAEVVLAALAAPAAGAALLKLLLGDLFHVEFHRGTLYFTLGVPSHGPALQPGAVEVRPTRDGRGNGAFAVVPIAKGTHVIDYEGEPLDRQAFFAKYPSGEGDYAMAIDDEWVLDAAHLVDATTAFSGVHMNHSRRGANVGRFYRRAERRVAFFALRDIGAGDELLYDYGGHYWRPRALADRGVAARGCIGIAAS